MSIIQDLIDEGALVLYHDYRSGSLRDWSGNGNDGTGTDVQWTNRGLKFPVSTSKVQVAHSAGLSPPAGAIVGFGRFTSCESEILVNKDNEYGVYVSGTPKIYMKDYSGVDRWVAATIAGKRCLGVNFEDGEKAAFHVNGSHVGDGNDTNTITADTNALTIGGPSSNLLSVLEAVLIVNRVLTSTEHAQLYAELAAMVWPTQGWRRGLGVYGPELVADRDMEKAGVTDWPAGNSATVTKEPGAAMAGGQVARVAHNGVNFPYIYQIVLTSGKTYRLTGWARGDGTHAPRFGVGGVFLYGTTSTDWQKFDFTATAGNNAVQLMAVASAAGYCEFDDISVREVHTPDLQFATAWGAHEIANVAPGSAVPGTPIEVQSGAFAVSVESADGRDCKVLENTNDGIWSLDASLFGGDPTQDAYGTWEGWIEKTDAGVISLGLVAQNPDALTAGDYVLEFAADESAKLKIQGGADIITGGSIDHSVPVHWKVTRSIIDGEWSLYLDGELVGTGTENTLKTCAYLIADMDNGCRVLLADLTGGHNLSKTRGVN